jgi:transcriptional regulator with XRE-family HTH domain
MTKFWFFRQISVFCFTKYDSNMVLIMPLNKYRFILKKCREPEKNRSKHRIAVLPPLGKACNQLENGVGLTQKGFGEKIGLTREAIAAYEAGRSHLIDTTLLDMAVILRVSVNEILGLERLALENPIISRRWAKRVAVIESLPESVKKHILRTLDDVIKANTRLSIFEDGQ